MLRTLAAKLSLWWSCRENERLLRKHLNALVPWQRIYKPNKRPFIHQPALCSKGLKPHYPREPLHLQLLPRRPCFSPPFRSHTPRRINKDAPRDMDTGSNNTEHAGPSRDERFVHPKVHYREAGIPGPVRPDIEGKGWGTVEGGGRVQGPEALDDENHCLLLRDLRMTYIKLIISHHYCACVGDTRGYVLVRQYKAFIDEYLVFDLNVLGNHWDTLDSDPLTHDGLPAYDRVAHESVGFYQGFTHHTGIWESHTGGYCTVLSYNYIWANYRGMIYLSCWMYQNIAYDIIPNGKFFTALVPQMLQVVFSAK